MHFIVLTSIVTIECHKTRFYLFICCFNIPFAPLISQVFFLFFFFKQNKTLHFLHFITNRCICFPARTMHLKKKKTHTCSEIYLTVTVFFTALRRPTYIQTYPRFPTRPFPLCVGAKSSCVILFLIPVFLTLLYIFL